MNYQKGQSIIELLIAIGLIAIITPALFAGFFATRNGRAQQEQREQAIQLVREGQEAARIVREADWNTFITNFANGNKYYPCKSGNTWSLCNGTETTSAGFKRNIVITIANRNTTGNIVTDGSGTPDKSTAQVITTVSWTTPLTTSVQATEYLTRTNTDGSFIDTSKTDFDKGTYNGTAVATPGQLLLQNNPAQANWCQPNLAGAATTSIPGNHQSSSTINAFATYSGNAGHSYTTSGSDGKGDSLDAVTVTDPVSPTPPAASLAGSYNIHGNGKSAAVYVDTTTNLAYLAANQVTVDVVDLSTLTEKYQYNASGGGSGTSVYISGGIGYVTDGKQLYAFNTTTNPGKELGKLKTQLAGNGLKVQVYGTKAYIATDSTSAPLQIVDVTDPTNMGTPQTVASVVNGQAGVDVSIDTVGGTTADFVTTYKNATTQNLFVINLSNNTVVYKMVATNPNSVAYVSGGVYVLIGGSGAQQYQVWQPSVSTSAPCGGLNNLNGSSSVGSVSYLKEPDGDVFAYVLATNGNSINFYAIPGGSGAAGGYVASGTYLSGTSWAPTLTLPSANPVSFNSFTVTYIKRANTDVKFQVAVGNATGGVCNTFSFAGAGEPPVSGFFTTPDVYSNNPVSQTYTIPFGTNAGGYANPATCFQYEVYLYDTNGNTTTTPEVDDMTVNYSL